MTSTLSLENLLDNILQPHFTALHLKSIGVVSRGKRTNRIIDQILPNVNVCPFHGRLSSSVSVWMCVCVSVCVCVFVCVCLAGCGWGTTIVFYNDFLQRFGVINSASVPRTADRVHLLCLVNSKLVDEGVMVLFKAPHKVLKKWMTKVVQNRIVYTFLIFLLLLSCSFTADL